MLLFMLLSWHAASQKVTATFLSKGNVYLKYGKKTSHPITKLGIDTLPILSQNKKFVLFLRHLPKQEGLTQIIRYDLTTAAETILVSACTEKPSVCTPISYANTDYYDFPCLGCIENVFLSPNNQRIYFGAEAWVVSAAIHYYDMTTGKVHFFSDGSINRIFSNGMLEIQTTGNDGNGRYWQNFLFDTHGNKIRPALGKKTY